MEFEYEEYYAYPTSACLNVTDSCNLACKYCFVQQHPHFMTWDIAKQAVDWLANNFKKREELNYKIDRDGILLTFFGGEPTLLWDEILVPVVLYCEETYPNLFHFTITTNATLLNDQRIEFLKEHNIPPLLSMDGNEEVQNFNRPQRNGQGSFDLVYKNIPKLLKEFPNTTFRATIYQQSCKETFEAFKFADECGFTNIFMCPNAREDWSEENLEILHQEIKKIITYTACNFMIGRYPISNAFLDQALLKIINHDIQVYNNDYRELNLKRGVMRCGLGTGSISIGYDGKVYGCQEQDSKGIDNYFYLGDIFSGIDREKHKIILNDYAKLSIIECEDPAMCKNCVLRSVCSEETCPSVSHDRFNNLFTRPKIDCLMAQWYFEETVKLMDLLVNKEPNEGFKYYLNQIFAPFDKERSEQYGTCL